MPRNPSGLIADRESGLTVLHWHLFRPGTSVAPVTRQRAAPAATIHIGPKTARSPGRQTLSCSLPRDRHGAPTRALRAPPCIPRQRELHHAQRVSGLRSLPTGKATVTVAGQRRCCTGFLGVSMGCARGGHRQESTGADGTGNTSSACPETHRAPDGIAGRSMSQLVELYSR